MKTVLIVDDSRTTRNYHSTILSSGGYHVVTASDGAEGLERLVGQHCDLILTDVNMQGLDGLEFIRRVRELPEHQNLPIVIVSTEGRDNAKHKGYAAGANLYVVKPSTPPVLLEYVQMMIGTAT